MDKKIRATLAGTLGEFWHDPGQVHDENAARPGYALQDAEFIVINIIRSRREYGNGSSDYIPDAVVGATEHSGSIFYDIRRMPSNFIMMASRVSTRRYYARGAIVGFHTSDLKSTNLYEMTIHLSGVTRWSGVAGSKTDNTQDEQGRLKSWRVETQSVPEQTSRLGGGLQVGLSTTWTADMDGPDIVSLKTPLAVTIRSSKPVDWYTLFNPLWSCQQLICLAYDGFVLASGGSAKLDVPPDDRPGTKPVLWSGLLMVKPDGVALPKGDTPIPHFRVGDIGGTRGLMRWIKLTRDHPRATGPLTARYSIGSKAAIESQLVDIAVAIEYWVSSHVRTSDWAKRAHKKEKKGETLARHGGRAFEAFVGDSKAWGTLFWDRYEALKHHAKMTYDHQELRLLVESARVLLAGVLLNEVAGKRHPMAVLVDSTNNYNLGTDIRNLISSKPALILI